MIVINWILIKKFVIVVIFDPANVVVLFCCLDPHCLPVRETYSLTFCRLIILDFLVFFDLYIKTEVQLG